MKNTLKLLSLILAVISLTLIISAAKTEPWKQIYTASDLVSAYKNGSLVPANLLVSEAYDDTGYYFRAKADSPSGATLKFTLPEAVDASKIATVIIGFRTNYPVVETGASKYVGIQFPKDNTFNYNNLYANYFFDRSSMDTKDGIVYGEILLEDVNTALVGNGATQIEFFKLNPWNGKELLLEEGVSLSNMYADIEFIGFFEKASEAKNFDYDKYSEGMLNFTTHTVTYIGKDGETIVATAVGGTALMSNIALIAWTLIKKKRLF